jgi:hypothetical protein
MSFRPWSRKPGKREREAIRHSAAPMDGDEAQQAYAATVNRQWRPDYGRERSTSPRDDRSRSLRARSSRTGRSKRDGRSPYGSPQEYRDERSPTPRRSRRDSRSKRDNRSKRDSRSPYGSPRHQYRHVSPSPRRHEARGYCSREQSPKCRIYIPVTLNRVRSRSPRDDDFSA